jgi:hypothetical protein
MRELVGAVEMGGECVREIYGFISDEINVSVCA